MLKDMIRKNLQKCFEYYRKGKEVGKGVEQVKFVSLLENSISSTCIMESNLSVL